MPAVNRSAESSKVMNLVIKVLLVLKRIEALEDELKEGVQVLRRNKPSQLGWGSMQAAQR